MHLKTSRYFFTLIMLLTMACEEEEIRTVKRYEGPMLMMKGTETLYSDSAELKVRLTAPAQAELQNGDREFPEGLMLEFYNDSMQLSSTLRANHGRYIKNENLYIGTGDVEVKNPSKGEQLNSEELKWNAKTGRVFTDKFVIIRTPSGIIKGTEFESDQTFTHYKIMNPTGEYEIEAAGQ